MRGREVCRGISPNQLCLPFLAELSPRGHRKLGVLLTQRMKLEKTCEVRKMYVGIKQPPPHNVPINVSEILYNSDLVTPDQNTDSFLSSFPSSPVFPCSIPSFLPSSFLSNFLPPLTSFPFWLIFLFSPSFVPAYLSLYFPSSHIH